MLIRSLLSFASRSLAGGALARAGLAAALSIGLSSVALAQEGISVEDDFESYSHGASLAAPWTIVTPTGSIQVVADANDLFGQGTSNLIVDYTKGAGSAQAMRLQNAFSAEVGRIAFDFVRPADGTEDTLSIILNVGNAVTANRAMLITISNTDINEVAYERGRVNRVEIVYNNSNYPVAYGEDRLLYPGTVDIWMNGELGRSGFSSSNTLRGAITSFEFNSASAREHQFYFDNIVIEPTEWEAVSSVAFSDNFESHTQSVPPEAPWVANPSTGGGAVTINADSSNLFGHGTDNKIVDYSKTGTSGAQTLILENKFAAEVGRMSFDFVRPADGTTGNLWFILHVGSRSGTNHRAQVITIGDDAIHGAGYNRGSVNHVELVFNNGHETVVYGDGNRIVGGTTDIWINGELKTTGFASQNNQRGAITTLEINSAGSAVHQFYFDNMVIEPVEWEISPPQVIFHDDFSAHTAGMLPGAPWTSVTPNDNPDRTGSAFIQKDSADLFGKGPDNQFMEYLANGDGVIVARSQNTFSGDLITFSARLINPTPVETPGYSWFIFNVGTPSGDSNRAQVITLDNRITDTFPEGGSRIAAREYPQNVPVQIDLVINNRMVPVEYGNGHTIQSGTTDVWIDGVLVRAGFSSQNNKLGPITTFELNVQGSARQHLLIDEITIWDHAVVDEAPVSGGFADWRAVHFPDDAENDDVSGPAADPRGDGVPNLLKYALGLDPAVASREGLPVSETRNIDGVDYLTISFERPADRDDVSYSVVATSDLSGWNDAAVLADTIDNGDGTVTEVWRDSEPLATSSARFLRLEVSLD